MFQFLNLLENVYFHIIIAPISLFGIFVILIRLFKMKWKSIELKVTLLIILTTLTLAELIVLILVVFKDNIMYYLISFGIGLSIFIYLLYFTIISIIRYSNNLVLAKDEIELSQKKYRNAYNNAELYKDVFTHDISNMLHNLTFSIDFYSSLPDKKRNEENYQEMINSCKNQIERGTELVRNVRVLSKLYNEENTLKSIEIKPVIQEISTEIKHNYLNYNIKIELETEHQKSIVQADTNLYYLFKNLILNGIIHNHNLQREISIKIRNTEKIYDNYIRIEIIDNGRGLDPQLKENYLKFFSSNEIEFRSGLGLMVVKGLISIYKGHIFIENRINEDYTKGTKVIIYLPKAINKKY